VRGKTRTKKKEGKPVDFYLSKQVRKKNGFVGIGGKNGDEVLEWPCPRKVGFLKKKAQTGKGI